MHNAIFSKNFWLPKKYYGQHVWCWINRKGCFDGKLKIHISENYYGKQLVDKDEAIAFLKSASIMNLVGRETISLAIDLGIGSESGVKIISDIPFLIIFNT